MFGLTFGDANQNGKSKTRTFCDATAPPQTQVYCNTRATKGVLFKFKSRKIRLELMNVYFTRVVTDSPDAKRGEPITLAEFLRLMPTSFERGERTDLTNADVSPLCM